MKEQIHNFVLRYIRRNMAHRNSAARDDIFRAINEGMREQFREDNLPTRLSCATVWLLQNDSVFMQNRHSDLVRLGMKGAISSAVQETVDE